MFDPILTKRFLFQLIYTTKTSVVLWRHTIRTGKVKLSKLTAAISGPFKGAKIAAFRPGGGEVDTPGDQKKIGWKWQMDHE